MLIEDWQEFVLIQANFGLLTNRAFAQLLAHLLSDKMGFGVVVQHDAYRIYVQTMGAAKADSLSQLFNEMQNMSAQAVRDNLIQATVKTGLFKRRMIHVAHRFGALKKWADFSSVSLQKLVESFQGTPIFEEALKEVFVKDLDVDRLVLVLEKMRSGEIVVQTLESRGEASPIARLGIERMSMKTDLIPPERMRAVLIESAKARLLNETLAFLCTHSWDYLEMIRIKDLPDNPTCPRCGSNEIGILKVEEEKVLPLVEKKGEKLTKNEEKLHQQALDTSKLVARYGKPAAVALAARRIRTEDVSNILQKMPKLSDKFYETVLEAERKAMSKRFW